jgi:hypothetical protein
LERCEASGKGDVAVVSMYSGHHVTTKNRARKIISEGDILNYKKAAEMKRHYHLTRRHFSRE